LQAQQGAQLSNLAVSPAFGHNEGPFGALAKIIAGARGGGMMNDAVQQLVAQRNAALPDLAKVYAADNPLNEIANGQHLPITMAQVLGGMTPEKAAQTRLALSQAGLYGARGTNLAATNEPMPGNDIVPSASVAGPAAKPSASAAPSSGASGLSFPSNGTYPGSAAAPPPLVQGADPMAVLANAPPPQRAQVAQRLTEAQKAMVAQRYRAMMAPGGRRTP